MRWMFVMLMLAAAGCGGDDEALVDAAPLDGAAVADAAPDGAIDAGPDAPAYGVPCGSDGALCVPGSSLGCCSNAKVDAGPACTPLGGLCVDDLQSCDGPEDCPDAMLCCDFGFAPTCGDPLDCVPRQGGTVCATATATAPPAPSRAATGCAPR